MNEKSSKEKTMPSKSPSKKWSGKLPRQSDCGIVGQGQAGLRSQDGESPKEYPKRGQVRNGFFLYIFICHFDCVK
jgi:hypothetical protein